MCSVFGVCACTRVIVLRFVCVCCVEMKKGGKKGKEREKKKRKKEEKKRRREGEKEESVWGVCVCCVCDWWCVYACNCMRVL